MLDIFDGSAEGTLWWIIILEIHLKSKIIFICGCTSLSKHVNRMSVTEEKQHEHKLQAKQHPMEMLFCEMYWTSKMGVYSVLFSSRERNGL